METIDNIYKNLFDNTAYWDYYKQREYFSYPFGSDDYSLCDNFIISYFRFAGKEIDSFRGFTDKLAKRSQHVVSTFFLGIYLYNNSDYIHNEVNKELRYNYAVWCNDFEIEREFTFIWFLISLFHDMGYIIEEEKNGKTPKYASFQEFLEIECNGKKLQKFTGIPKIYANAYKPYFEYRINVHHKNDHGICAAFLLFKNLCEIRARKEKEKDSTPEDKLYWGKSLIKIYNFAAWIILSHNIWYGDKNDPCKMAEYNCAGLKDFLIDDKEFKIRFEDHPTFFLFCLVDSIEFLKSVKDISLLKKIELGINNGNSKECEIVVESKLACGCNDNVLKSVKDLNTWLTATEKIGDKTIKIHLQPK